VLRRTITHPKHRLHKRDFAFPRESFRMEELLKSDVEADTQFTPPLERGVFNQVHCNHLPCFDVHVMENFSPTNHL